MSFCKTCGAIMIPEKNADTGKIFLVCPKCSVTNEVTRSKDDYLDLEAKQGAEKAKTVVIDKSELDQDALASVDARCPKCGHEKAMQWSLQTRSADEASTVFFRCTRCEQTWRDYGG